MSNSVCEEYCTILYHFWGSRGTVECTINEDGYQGSEKDDYFECIEMYKNCQPCGMWNQRTTVIEIRKMCSKLTRCIPSTEKSWNAGNIMKRMAHISMI